MKRTKAFASSSLNDGFTDMGVIFSITHYSIMFTPLILCIGKLLRTVLLILQIAKKFTVNRNLSAVKL